MNKEYPAEQREAAGEIDDAIFDKVAQDCPDARIMLVHQFGDYTARTHKKDGKPVVTREVVRGGLVVFRARGVHFCQIPSSPASLRANVEVRLALKEHAVRELGRRKDSSYDNDDVGKGMLDVLEILATGEQESPEYQASLNMEKTNELVAMVGNLREEPLETIMAGVKEFGELYGGRGFTVESGRNGDKKRKAEGGETRGKERGSKKGRTDHARGGTGVRRKITLAGDILRSRPESTEIPPFVNFKCPKEGCGNVHELGDRWFFNILQKKWMYVGPRCQPKGGHSAAEMEPCPDTEGKEVYGDKEMKTLPFVGNNRASKVVANNQDAYAVWLTEDAARLKK